MPTVEELKQTLVKLLSADEAAPGAHQTADVIEQLIEAKIEEANFKPSRSRPSEPTA